MAKFIRFLPLLLVLCIHFLPSALAEFNVVAFGAKTDGKTDSTTAFLGAWAAACNSTSPATMHVPSGKFLVGVASFTGPCKNKAIKIWIEGTILAPSNYDSLGKSGKWLSFDHIDGLSIMGGTLDGQGAALWSCKGSKGNCPSGPASLTVSHSTNVKIIKVTSINSKLFHIALYGCTGVTVDGAKITAPGNSPNTDGIHVQGSSGVTITGATIKTGDDCISIGPGCSNLWIEKVSCGSGHGVSIGSLANSLNEAGVQNVTVKSVTFTGTQNGIRIKTWGRPSNGFVKGVVYQQIIMKDVQNPIFIDQSYCPSNKGCPNQNSGIKISQVTYNNVQGTSATQVAVNFNCSPSNPCSQIKLQDIKLLYQNKPALSSCKYVGGTSSGILIPASCV